MSRVLAALQVLYICDAAVSDGFPDSGSRAVSNMDFNQQGYSNSNLFLAVGEYAYVVSFSADGEYAGFHSLDIAIMRCSILRTQ
jgi:hypothetical protein